MDRTYTAIANSQGAAVATVDDGPPRGLCWVVAQISISTNVFRAGATATIARSGNFLSSSSLGSNDTAYGPPAIVLNAEGQLTCTWSGLTPGDQAKMTIWYSEQPNSATPNPDFVV